MNHSIKNQDAKILVVEAAQSSRSLICDSLRALGFKSIHASVGSLKDALPILETEHIDWIITSTFADQKVNAMQILKICASAPNLKHVRMSLLVDKGDDEHIPIAYQIGLLSHHSREMTGTAVKAFLQILFDRFKSEEYNDALVAASYLREWLTVRSDWESSYKMTKNLLEVMPGRPDLITSLAEPLFAMDKKQEARATLEQAKMILDGPKIKQVDALGERIFGEDYAKPIVAGTEAPNILGIPSVVLIDSDEMTLKNVKGIFSELGVPAIETFQDGESAWLWMQKNPEPGLIIMEWKIPKVPGPALLQRVRGMGFLSVPIIVLSSLIKPTDMPLLREMSVANQIAKPFPDRPTFLRTVIWTLQQERIPTDMQVLETKIRQLLQIKKPKEANSLKKRLFADKAFPLARRKYIEAEFAYANGKYEESRDHALQGLKSVGDKLLTLQLLGKVFMQLKDFASALKCLEKANEINPVNIERLCMMAEAETELGKEEDAKKSVNEAEEVDAENADLIATKAKFALTDGNTDRAKELMGKLTSLSSVVSYMNNKAIALSRTGKIDEGLELYHKAIRSIPDNRKNVLGAIHYNVALAYIRADKPQESLEHLFKAATFDDQRIARKAASLQKRVEDTIKRGVPLKIIESNGPPTPDEHKPKPETIAADPLKSKAGAKGADKGDDEVQIASKLFDDAVAKYALDNLPGDRCCYQIFVYRNGIAEKTKKLLEHMPRFAMREAVEREESMGAEMANKKSA